MAAGWPTKVTYADGDVFSASNINDTNGTLNYIDPTSATDKQVLTRDAASGGKVKWADSPANTLTTTGDLYYASAANTPARLGIGATDQVLKVSGGVPVWGSAPSAMTLIATNTISSGTTSVFSSIPGTYKTLKAIGKMNSGSTYTFEVNAGLTSTATRYGYLNSTPAWVLAASTGAAYVGNGTGLVGWDCNFFDYTSVTTQHSYGTYGTSASGPLIGGGVVNHASGAITTITFFFVSGSVGSISLYGIS